LTTKKVILLSAATCLALNSIVWLLGWLAWPIVFIGGWFLLGCVARKISSYTHMKNDWAWNYLFSSAFPPITIMVSLLNDWREISYGLKQEYNIFNRLPKFQNPFVWPEKEEK
jgi:hypothetical protein